MIIRFYTSRKKRRITATAACRTNSKSCPEKEQRTPRGSDKRSRGESQFCSDSMDDLSFRVGMKCTTSRITRNCQMVAATEAECVMESVTCGNERPAQLRKGRVNRIGKEYPSLYICLKEI